MVNREMHIHDISVSTAGDVNRDGYSDVIIGASWYDNGQTNEGAAFVYYGYGNKSLDVSLIYFVFFSIVVLLFIIVIVKNK